MDPNVMIFVKSKNRLHYHVLMESESQKREGFVYWLQNVVLKTHGIITKRLENTVLFNLKENKKLL